MGNEAEAWIIALGSIWNSIQRHHPAVPSVVILPMPVRQGRLGHFAPLRWRAPDGASDLHEVAVAWAQLDAPPERVLEVLLHEAAHALNFVRGIPDCSSTSQYHNRKFAAAARELGLTAQNVANYGFASTALTEGAFEKYAVELTQLASVTVQRPRGLRRAARSQSTLLLKAICPCGHWIRARGRVFEATSVTCGRCGEAFRVESSPHERM